jgi:hypothetical protein
MAHTIAFELPLAEMLGVVPGYVNAVAVCAAGTLKIFAFVILKALSAFPTDP